MVPMLVTRDEERPSPSALFLCTMACGVSIATMKAKVTPDGVQVPRRMLGEAEEVEIRLEEGRIIVVPLVADDPIAGLGTAPVACEAPDASEEHDRYLYRSGG